MKACLVFMNTVTFQENVMKVCKSYVAIRGAHNYLKSLELSKNLVRGEGIDVNKTDTFPWNRRTYAKEYALRLILFQPRILLRI